MKHMELYHGQPFVSDLGPVTTITSIMSSSCTIKLLLIHLLFLTLQKEIMNKYRMQIAATLMLHPHNQVKDTVLTNANRLQNAKAA